MHQMRRANTADAALQLQCVGDESQCKFLLDGELALGITFAEIRNPDCVLWDHVPSDEEVLGEFYLSVRPPPHARILGITLKS